MAKEASTQIVVLEFREPLQIEWRMMGWDMVHEANLLGIWVPDFDDGVTTEMQNISFPIG